MNLYPSEFRIANRYEVAGKPLFGGMGLVYLCYDHHEQRPVALKTFQPQFLPDRAARDRFLREGDTWVRLGRHPHVVRCYGVQRIGDGREVYLVLELVARDTTQERRDASLRSWLTPGQPLPLKTALLFALQIARGMQHATETLPGFVHRDLKPENLLVGADKVHGSEVNRLRVTDFGLASVLVDIESNLDSSQSDSQASHPSRTQLTHGIAGTPLYMAPEQWRGEPLTPAADIYAFGCILYEMLSGRHPVRADNIAQASKAHLAGDFEPLSTELPETVRLLVARCLERKTSDRLQSWAATVQTIGAAYQQYSGRAVPASPASVGLSREERLAAGWAFNSLGSSYIDIGKAAVAIEFFRRAQEVGDAEDISALVAAGLGNLGISYDALGNFQVANECYVKALAVHQRLGDRNGEASILTSLGNNYLQFGDAQRAADCINQALGIAREVGDRHGEGIALSSLGGIYFELGDNWQAIELFEQALTLHQETDSARSQGIAMDNLGNAYARLGDLQRAIKFYESSLVISKEIGDWRGEAITLGNLGITYGKLGDKRQAIKYNEDALAISREIGDRQGESNLLINLGNAHSDLGDMQMSIAYYDHALTISHEIGDRSIESTVLGNLGNVYGRMGDTRRAIEYYKQALDILGEQSSRYREISVMINLGNAYLDQSDIDAAIDHFEKVLTVSRELRDQHNEGRSLSSLGYAYLRQDNVLKSIWYFEEALAVHRVTGNQIEIASTAYNIALLCAQNEIDVMKSLTLAEESAALYSQMGYHQEKQDAQQLAALVRSLS